MRLNEVMAGETHLVQDVKTDDEEMRAFLFRLGCYEGEPITLISKRKSGCVVAIKDGRYSLDNYLAEAIVV
ncbi:MAG: ferrous iron transport protein A [Clostridiales bacterium]|nr:ferrous iron transport protein A [Candidatus Crickella merdequi]